MIFVLAAASGMTACETPPPDPVEAARLKASPSLASDDNPYCRARMHSGLIRPGDNIPVSMMVQNTSRWCFAGFGWSGQTAMGSTIVDRPAHGQLRLQVRGNALLYGYRPNPGFTGADSFLISVPGGAGESDNLAVTVSVRA